eukprot:475984_1
MERLAELVRVKDGWDKEFVKNHISYDGNKATSLSGGTPAVFLKYIVKDGVHEWQFKLLNSSIVLIGIVISTVNNNSCYGCYPWFEIDSGYCFAPSAATINNPAESDVVWPGNGTKYGIKCKTNDVIGMRLDFRKKSLNYSINCKDYGKAFDIDPKRKYKACVRLSGENSSVEFMGHHYDNLVKEERKQNLEVEKIENISNSKQQIDSLQELVKQLTYENESLKKKVYVLENEKKEMEMTMNAMNKQIEDLKSKSLDLSNYKQWNDEKVLIWIMSLDDGKYKQYHETLKKELNTQKITGNDLQEMDVNDLKGLGIIQFQHKKIID